MISSILSIILTAIILRYVVELEKERCECSLSWQHRFIKYFAPIIIVVSLIALLMGTRGFLNAVRSNAFIGTLFMLYVAVGLVYGVILVLYFLKLRYSQCQCARDWKQYGLLYPVISFAIGLLVVLVINAIMVFNLLPMIVEKVTGKKQSKGASSKQLLNDLSNSVKNNSGRGRRGRK